MKTLIFFVLVFFYGNISANAQSQQGEQIAERIAIRLKDSLLLTDVQKDSIYSINLQLYQQSRAVRAESLPADTLQAKLQRIENMRDPKYRQVMGLEKFQLYKQRKIALVYGN